MTGKLADLRPAVGAFLDFATETRPDWDRSELEGALTAAGSNRPGDRSVGEHWAATQRAASRLLADAAATPRDLLAQVRDPLRRDAPDGTPETRAAIIAEAKRAAAETQVQARAELAASLAAGAGESQ